MNIPAGIPSDLPRDIINQGLSSYPDLADYKRIHGITHYEFRVLNRADGYAVSARPWANWRERANADDRFWGE